MPTVCPRVILLAAFAACLLSGLPASAQSSAAGRPSLGAQAFTVGKAASKVAVDAAALAAVAFNEADGEHVARRLEIGTADSACRL